MAIIKCKEPDCPCEIDTYLYCVKAVSLLRMYNFFEEEQEKYLPGTEMNTEISGHLAFVKSEISAFKFKDEQKIIAAFKPKRSLLNVQVVHHPIRKFYLTCAKDHSYYYDVDCNQ